VACFPLYPLLIRGLGVVFGGRYVLAGIVISNLAAWVGFVLLFQWVGWSRDRESAWLAVSAALAFPTGVFWGAVYPQSLFFALSVGSLALMLDGRTATASLVCALATATRLEAVALIPCLLFIRLGQGGWRPVLSDLWFLTAPLGLVGYMAYLQANWGDPILFIRVHQLFQRGLTNPLSTLFEPGKHGGLGGREWIVFGTYVVFGLLIFGFHTKVRRSILLYGWLLFMIPLASGSYISIYRVHQVNLALYLIVGMGFTGGWRRFGWSLVVLSALMEAWLMFLWAIGYLLP
jgi:Gpi18-like mannosyltransferase